MIKNNSNSNAVDKSTVAKVGCKCDKGCTIVYKLASGELFVGPKLKPLQISGAGLCGWASPVSPLETYIEAMIKNNSNSNAVDKSTVAKVGCKCDKGCTIVYKLASGELFVGPKLKPLQISGAGLCGWASPVSPLEGSMQLANHNCLGHDFFQPWYCCTISLKFLSTVNAIRDAPLSTSCPLGNCLSDQNLSRSRTGLCGWASPVSPLEVVP
ncbi:hypothetical protein DCAR_0103404 [Daucus carota subsp. sativus]|uniref:Uncharacterized protein n=1 Tax=Daucus carota subsp. sativus TaxID=79200 RepID=A0A166HYW8_DAUCS|nr:hypothetical protein DCAR_0103404 [Daucus carota subsp. sativus]